MEHARRVPLLVLHHTISLNDVGKNVFVRRLEFSPDGRLLAAEVDGEIGKTLIVILDAATGKKLSLIPSPVYSGMDTATTLQWVDGGTIISLNAKYRWNALAATRLPDIPVIGRLRRFNRDRTKLFSAENGLGTPSYLHIYDTGSWQGRRFSAEGFSIKAAAWTADDNVLLSVANTQETFGKTIAGHVIKSGFDRALRLFDPSAEKHTKTVWFPAQSVPGGGHIEWQPSASLDLGISCFASNLITIGTDQYVDGGTLQISRFYPDQKIDEHKAAPAGGHACSADGHYLFAKDTQWLDGSHQVANAIIDLEASKVVATFPGGHIGISASADGKFIAVGNKNSILTYSIK